jgi:hypothetical protein
VVLAFVRTSHPLVRLLHQQKDRRARTPSAAVVRLARGERPRDTAGVYWGSFSYAFGPLLALVAVGVLTLLLRWTSSHGHSLVERRPTVGTPTEYGLLVPVAEPPTFVEAELLRRRLEGAGLRATLAPTSEGPRVLVFPEDVKAARLVLRR